jgi:hypothetical protein
MKNEGEVCEIARFELRDNNEEEEAVLNLREFPTTLFVNVQFPLMLEFSRILRSDAFFPVIPGNEAAKMLLSRTKKEGEGDTADGLGSIQNRVEVSSGGDEADDDTGCSIVMLLFLKVMF